VTIEKLQKAAALGCLVFAAQAVNVPVLPGVSGHLLGGVLLAAMLGPGLAAWTMAIVLAIQAVALGDGGLVALGANVLNMAIVPAVLTAAVTRVVSEKRATSYGVLATTACAAVVLAAGLIVGETALGRAMAELHGWQNFAAIMLSVHLWIGVMEAIVTAAAVVAISHFRAPALARWSPAFGAAIVIAVLLWSPGASSPDGYEASARLSGVATVLMR